MFSIFARKPAKTTTSAKAAAPKGEHEPVVSYARTAIQLPAGYFKGWSAERFYVPVTASLEEVEGNEAELSQSPLHRIMNGGHSDVPEGERSALWADDRYVSAVKWVLANQCPEEAAEWSKAMSAHGYWRPMAEVVRLAVEKGYVGCRYTKTYDKNGVKVVFG